MNRMDNPCNQAAVSVGQLLLQNGFHLFGLWQCFIECVSDESSQI
ncbi:unknown [Prevotella sp. CAG:924]|nr:unknown [Prevotella sp. CAG:924]